MIRGLTDCYNKDNCNIESDLFAVRDLGHTARVRGPGRRGAPADRHRHTPRSLRRHGGRRRDHGRLCSALRRRLQKRQATDQQDRRRSQDRQARGVNSSTRKRLNRRFTIVKAKFNYNTEIFLDPSLDLRGCFFFMRWRMYEVQGVLPWFIHIDLKLYLTYLFSFIS